MARSKRFFLTPRSGLAMVEAYVLAGELGVCGDDYSAAFVRFESRMAPFLAQKQRSAARLASSFAPKSQAGIAFRNLVTKLMGWRPIADFFIGRELRDDIEIPDYKV